MDQAVPKYRCYFTDLDGHFVGVEEVDACALSGAITQARRILRAGGMRHAVGFEVWIGVDLLFTSCPRSAGPRLPGSR
jgi:hypothetical protein